MKDTNVLVLNERLRTVSPIENIFPIAGHFTQFFFKFLGNVKVYLLVSARKRGSILTTTDL